MPKPFISQTLVDGCLTEVLPLTDRGLQYGDGIFRTMRWQVGGVLDWDLHYAVLQRDARTLGLFCPPAACWLADIQQLCGQDVDVAVIKLILTRGDSVRGYLPASSPVRRIVQRLPFQAYPDSWYQQGVVLQRCALRLAQQEKLAGCKHLNRLEQVLARQSLLPSAQEGLLLNTVGEVVSGIMSNIYWLKAGVLHTPSLLQAGIAGVQRAKILQACVAQQQPVRIGSFSVAELKLAEVVFVSNSLMGIVPVSAFEEIQWQSVTLLPSLLNRVNLNKKEII